MADKELCATCNRLIKKVPRERKAIENEDKETLYSSLLDKRINIGYVICEKYRKRAIKNRTGEYFILVIIHFFIKKVNLLSVGGIGEDVVSEVGLTSDKDPTFETLSPRTSSTKTIEAEYVKIDLPRTISNHRYCCILRQANI